MSATQPTPTAPRRQRVSQADRKVEIAHTAARLFAERGFHATGSRDLARACGVSETLMFRYFPSKEELWKAALEACRRNAIADSLRSLPEQEPSSAALVVLTRHLAESYIYSPRGERVENRDIIHRMLLRSLAEDGEFARLVVSDLSERLVGYTTACLRAARAAGDLTLSEDEAEETAATFYRLLFFAIGSQRLPHPPAVDFHMSDDALVAAFVRFQLRAVGFTPEAIDRELRA